MTQTQIFTFRLLLVIALTAVTYLATTRSEYPIMKEISDKANHILAFYVLALLVDFSFPESRFGLVKFAALLAYGLLLEITQSFLPNRQASLLDMAADGAGSAAYRLSLPLIRHLPLLNRR
jgi:VanZ family protein